MSLEALVIWLIVGGVAGWLGSQIMKSGGLKLTGHHIADTVITGLVGAVLGGFLLGALKISFGAGLVGSIISAALGAVVLIFALGMIKK